jgi:NAD+ synthase
MADRLTLALAQLNPTVGDVTGNLALIRAARAAAAADGADLVVCPELVLCGYPPEDLVLKPRLIAVVDAALAELAADTADGGPGLLVGAPVVDQGRLHNAAVLLDGGRRQGQRFKHALPNYGVFDEKRVFVPGPLPGPLPFRGWRLGVMVCEDMWSPDVTECLAESGAEMLVVLNGSPWDAQNAERRMSEAVARVVETGLPLAYVNQVGGQDELVFDGASFVLDADRRVVARAPAWVSARTMVGWTRDAAGRVAPTPGAIAPAAEGLAAIYDALVLGLADYVGKNGFPGVILGLSGGIDSALSAAIAVDALGRDKVWAVMMPSPYTSRDSLEDAAACARLLGIRLDELSIRPAMDAFAAMLAPLVAGTEPGITEENIQSRARGLTLMALSNKFGPMVLSTGNKSELSVGYATLYGDMCGGFAVLKDVYKTTVFALCGWRNANKPAGALGPDGPVMPQRVIDKPPTAELRPNQKDEDSLPPYAVLDAVLECLVEQDLGLAETIARDHDRATVERVWRMLDRAEYKRRQGAPGPKITPRLFNRERRYPITNRFVASALAED